MSNKKTESRQIHVTETCGKIEEKWWCVSKDEVAVETRHSGSKAPTVVARVLHSLEDVFLPEGYPGSVSPDYARYQVFDTLQALCSSITGTLSTRAVLKGVGVGDAAATAMSGTLTWLLRDGAGMFSRVVFAAVMASDLDHDAKRWRLAADVTNDIGMLINILSEHVPPQWFLPLTCVASVFFAVTGCAGGATRASLTQHFAQRHNTADVSAKDGSQETAVGLVGMFAGMAVAVLVPQTFWPTLAVVLFFVCMHLLTNYLGVKSLILEHLNENRLVLCLRAFAESGGAAVPTPAAMRSLEGVVLPGPRIRKKVSLGCSLRDTLTGSAAAVGSAAASSSSATIDILLQQATDSLESKRYFVCEQDAVGSGSYNVVLASEAGHMDILAAYVECVVSSGGLKSNKEKDTKLTVQSFVEALRVSGWKCDRFQLRLGDWRVQKTKNKHE